MTSRSWCALICASCPVPLVTALARIRGTGFRYTFDTARVSPNLLLETALFLFRIDSALTSGLPESEQCAAIVDGIPGLAVG